MSRHKDTVVEAHKRGYFVEPDGKAYSPTAKRVGYISRKTRFGHTYSVEYVSVNCSGLHRKFATHMLQAYQKFGDAIFEKGIHVRHLDGNSLNNHVDNIAMGTPSENSLDRTPEARMEHAYKATAKIRIPEEKWVLCDADRAAGISFRDLNKKYGFHKSTLSYRYSQKAKRTRTTLEDALAKFISPPETTTAD